MRGKFGLVNAYTRIPDYDQKINTKADIERVRGISKDKLEFLTKIYGKIFLVMGNKYRNVLEPILDESGKFYVLIEEKGIFAWNKVLSQFAEFLEKELLHALENYRLIKSNVNPNIQKLIEVLKK